jgi:hypothetical protein
MIKAYGWDRVNEIENLRLPPNHVWDLHELAATKVRLLEDIKIQEKRLGI